jgi:putative sugar O-methyltransferase
MLLERIARKLRVTLLPPPNKRESKLIGELRQSISQLPPLTPENSETSAEGIWTRHRITIREKILHDDPRRFLNWEVIRNTMFFSNTPYITPAFESLRRSEKWESRWRAATRESQVGLPLKFPGDTESSGNLIHQVYHLSQFEEQSGKAIEEFKTIVEFGGGYGSTCRVAHQLGFGGSYFIFDLPELSALQRFYLKMNGVNVSDASRNKDAPNAVVCLSSIDELLSQLENRAVDLFIANWSLSETPLELRKEFLPLVAGAGAFLIGYQDDFGEVDNRQFFADWSARQPGVSWTNVRIDHLPANNYLIGTRNSEHH